MTTTTLRRLLTAAISVALVLGLFFGYRAWAASARMETARQLAAQVENLPPGQDNGLRDKLRAAMGRLTPRQRREVFEGGFERRMTEFFKLSLKERNDYLDKMIRRDLARRAAPRPAGARRGGPGGGAAVAKAATGGANGGAANGGPQGGGQGRPPQTAEQRAQQRRARLDQTSPEQRGMRAEFARAMKTRRQQLGLR